MMKRRFVLSTVYLHSLDHILSVYSRHFSWETIIKLEIELISSSVETSAIPSTEIVCCAFLIQVVPVSIGIDSAWNLLNLVSIDSIDDRELFQSLDSLDSMIQSVWNSLFIM